MLFVLFRAAVLGRACFSFVYLRCVAKQKVSEADLIGARHEIARLDRGDFSGPAAAAKGGNKKKRN